MGTALGGCNSDTRQQGAKAMLVLTRRPSETVRIGTEIEIRVTRVEGHKVRLAIIAPRSVPIVRGELLTVDVPAVVETDCYPNVA